jgi:large subunit ribosomal protein L3
MPVQALIGKKVGTTQVFQDTGTAVCVTAVTAGPCTITQIKQSDTDGYDKAQLGFEEVKGLNKPRTGQQHRVDKLYRYLREVDADEIPEIEVGQEVDAGLFEPGDLVDATGTSKGRGFAGGVKRHRFHGGPKTHGQSDRHRAPGSIGAGSSPGRVVKGHKMAGHMGNARVTVRNLEVIRSDPDQNLLLLKGAVPGAHNSLVMIRKTGKKA